MGHSSGADDRNYNGKHDLVQLRTLRHIRSLSLSRSSQRPPAKISRGISSRFRNSQELCIVRAAEMRHGTFGGLNFFFLFPLLFLSAPLWPTFSTTTIARRPNRGHIGGVRAGPPPAVHAYNLMFLSRVGSALPPSSTVKSICCLSPMLLLTSRSQRHDKQQAARRRERRPQCYVCTYSALRVSIVFRHADAAAVFSRLPLTPSGDEYCGRARERSSSRRGMRR